MYIDDSRIKRYQDYFLQFNWFQPLLIGLSALLVLIGIILVFSIFKPTYRKPGLYKIIMMDIFMYHVKQSKSLHTIH